MKGYGRPHLFKASSFKLTICLINGWAGGQGHNRCSYNLGPQDILDSIQLFH